MAVKVKVFENRSEGVSADVGTTYAIDERRAVNPVTLGTRKRYAPVTAGTGVQVVAYESAGKVQGFNQSGKCN